MKGAFFFIGFFLIYIGVSPAEETPLWYCIPPILLGIVSMYYSLPKPKNRYKR